MAGEIFNALRGVNDVIAGRQANALGAIRNQYAPQLMAQQAQQGDIATQLDQAKLREAQRQPDLEAAKQAYVAAQYVIQSPQPRQMVETQFPEIAAQLRASGIPLNTDADYREAAQHVAAHFGAMIGQAPIPQMQTIGDLSQPDKGILQRGPNGELKQIVAPKDNSITPYQQQQIDIERQKLKMQEAQNNPFGMMGQQGGGQQAAPPSTGDAYLATLPKNIADQVKALAEGRMQFPGGFALKSPYWQQMISAVSQYDPSFDAVNYNARASTRKDFTSGKNAQNIKSLNTAIGHLGTLEEQIADTASHSFTPLNTIENFAKQNMGSAGPTKFAQTATALASELTQVFRGSGGAEADVKRYLSELNVNASDEQKRAAVNNIVDLLHSRLSAIGDQYNQGMGTTSDPLTLLNPKAQGVLDRLEGRKSGIPAAAPQGQWKVEVVK